MPSPTAPVLSARLCFQSRNLRPLVEMDGSLREALKKNGLLTRDPREKESKKYGRKRARKRFQFSKR